MKIQCKSFWLMFGLSLASFCGAQMKGPDFNQDGFDDAVFGMPHVDFNGMSSVGQVLISYGSSSGLQSVKGKRLLHRNIEDVQGVFSDQANFGESITWGDFNHDGYDDLVVGVPGDTINNHIAAGSVQVFYGSKACAGLCQDWNQIFHRDLDGMQDAAEAGDHFGAAVIAGDFNGDGIDDLAIGVPDDSLMANGSDLGIEKAGSVHILYGSLQGLSVEGNQIFHLGDIKAWGDMAYKNAQTGSRYASVLTAGDYNCDGMDDLAVGVPNYNWLNRYSAGIVHVIYGGRQGLSYDQINPQIWFQGLLSEEPEANDHFGASLASGNLNADQFRRGTVVNQVAYECQDLVVGVPYEDVQYGYPYEPVVLEDQGIVHVIYGGGNGLTDINAQYFTRDTKNEDFYPFAGDLFGFSVAVAEFNEDEIDDLLVGVPHDQNYAYQGGSVQFFAGSFSGIETDFTAFFDQDNFVLAGDIDENDQFGFSLGAGNFNGKGQDEIIAGAPFSTFSNEGEKITERGMIIELHADMNPPQLTFDSSIWIHGGLCVVFDPYKCKDFDKAQNDPGPKAYDHFGWVMTSMRPIVEKIYLSPQDKKSL